jgi:hypothetical protein
MLEKPGKVQFKQGKGEERMMEKEARADHRSHRNNLYFIPNTMRRD